jgi:hypothetical protein
MFSDFYHGFYFTTLILSSVAALFLFSKVNRVFRFVCVLIISTLINEYLSRYFRDVLHKSNGIIYNLFAPVEYFLYLCIYDTFFQSRRLRTALRISFFAFVFLCVVNFIFLEPVFSVGTNIMNLENDLLVFLSLTAFAQFRYFHVADNILKESMFWFNSAVLIYYAYNILFWGFHSMKVYSLHDPPMIIYDINLLLSAILYLVYIYAAWLNAKQQKNMASSYE